MNDEEEVTEKAVTLVVVDTDAAATITKKRNPTMLLDVNNVIYLVILYITGQ